MPLLCVFTNHFLILIKIAILNSELPNIALILLDCHVGSVGTGYQSNYILLISV